MQTDRYDRKIMTEAEIFEAVEERIEAYSCLPWVSETDIMIAVNAAVVWGMQKRAEIDYEH